MITGPLGAAATQEPSVQAGEGASDVGHVTTPDGQVVVRVPALQQQPVVEELGGPAVAGFRLRADWPAVLIAPSAPDQRDS